MGWAGNEELQLSPKMKKVAKDTNTRLGASTTVKTKC
jgi:hypothetical protein